VGFILKKDSAKHVFFFLQNISQKVFKNWFGNWKLVLGKYLA